MAVAALVLFGAFVALTGVRAVIQFRRTGEVGTRQWSIRPGSTQWWGHWVMNLGGLIVGVAAPIAALTGLPPLAVLEHPVAAVVGVVLAVAGVLAVFAAQLTMGVSWRIAVDETEHTGLVTRGPFRLVRNPIFATMLVAFLGLALMVPNVLALVGFLATLVGVEVQVRLVEEPYLYGVHAAAYADYTARVGRFLPGIGRIHRPHGG